MSLPSYQRGITAGLTGSVALRVLRAEAKSRGLCGECRCRFPIPGKVTCEHCLAMHAEIRASHKARGRRPCGRAIRTGHKNCSRCRARRAKWQVAIASILAERGTCRRCKHFPAVAGRASCFGCLDKAMASSKAYYRARGSRPNTRRCSMCGETGHIKTRHLRGVERVK